MNIGTILGRLTRDVETKFTASEMAIANFSIAVDGRRKDDESSFFDCTAFGKTAEAIAKWFSKGKPIILQYRLQQERWEKDGQKRSKVSLIVEGFSFIPKTNDDAPAAASDLASQQVQAAFDAEEAPF